MEKITITTTRQMAEDVAQKNIGEKVTFQVSPSNQSVILAMVGGTQVGFLLETTEPQVGTVLPRDLEYDFNDYNWLLTECRDGKAKGTHAIYLIATGTPKKARKNMGKVNQFKFIFDFENETSKTFSKFKEERANTLLPLAIVEVKDEKIVLTYEDVVIGTLQSTNCDVESSALIEYLSENRIETHVGAMREDIKTFEIILPIKEADIVALKQQASSGILSDKINWILKHKITTKENLKEILDYLTICGVSTELQLKVLNTYKVYPKEVRSQIKPKPPVPFVDQHGFIRTSVAAIVKEKHLRYDGPKGAGKNLAIDTLSWVFQRPLFRVSFNKQTDESVLFGEKTLETNIKDVILEELSENATTEETMKVFTKNMTNLFNATLEKSQNVVFERGPLTLAMEYGGFLNLDEINFANQANASILNNALDDNRSVYVPGYKLVNAVENFVSISTMNDGYVGTSQMNQALRDRFYPVMFEYPTDMSTFLKVRYPNANPKYLETIDSIYKDMVNHVRDIEDLDPDSITTRGFIDVMDLADDLGLEEALIGAIVNRADNQDTRDLLRTIIDMHV